MTDLPKPANLPAGYIHIDPVVAIHISTIRKFTTDIKAMMKFLEIAIQYDITSDPDALMEIETKCNIPLEDVAARMGEHGEMLKWFSATLTHGDWPDDEPLPRFLRSSEETP